MGERNEWINNYLLTLSEELNSKYPGIVTLESVKQYIKMLSSTEYSKEELIALIHQMKEKKINEYLNRKFMKNIVSQEKKYDLNELFNCRISNGTLHIHVVPTSIKKELSKIGVNKYLEYVESRLLDAFSKISSILMLEENLNIQSVFAVSPLLRVKQAQSLFKKYGFEVKMSDSELFKKMFQTDRIGQAKISRDDFLLLERKRKEKAYYSIQDSKNNYEEQKEDKPLI